MKESKTFQITFGINGPASGAVNVAIYAPKYAQRLVRLRMITYVINGGVITVGYPALYVFYEFNQVQPIYQNTNSQEWTLGPNSSFDATTIYEAQGNSGEPINYKPKGVILSPDYSYKLDCQLLNPLGAAASLQGYVTLVVAPLKSSMM